jgi:methionyl-tRNA formyltransferase
MSGVGAPAPANQAPSATVHADGLIALAAFVQDPKYVDRVNELRAAEAAAREQQRFAEDYMASLKKEDVRIVAERSHLAAAQREFEAMRSATTEKYSRWQDEIWAREQAVAEKEQIVGSHHKTVSEAIVVQCRELDDRQMRQDQREKELAKLQVKLDMDAADLARRLAKLREATS